MKYYWLYGYLLGYLSIQLHEALHWLVACLLGYRGEVGGYGLALDPSVPPGEFIAIAVAGTFATIAYAVVGLVLYSSKDLFVKQMGFMLVFINGMGRVLYEFSSFFTGMAPDETGIAHRLGVPDLALRAPVTLFCVLTLAVILRDRDTGLRRPGRLGVLLLSLLVGIGQVLAVGSLVAFQQALGRWLFQPVLLGYTPFLAVINLLFVFFFYIVFRQGFRKSRSLQMGSTSEVG
jgi:hypothetical protein